MKKRKNKIPAFIPNRPKIQLSYDDYNTYESISGTMYDIELRKQKENQRKLMLNNKNNKY